MFLSLHLRLIILSQKHPDYNLFETIMHFQSSIPTGLRGHPELPTTGKKFTKCEVPTELKISNGRRSSLLNLFLSTSAILLLRFLGETIRLPPVLTEGKSLSTSLKGKRIQADETSPFTYDGTLVLFG